MDTTGLTQHARVRMQQRGIGPEVIEDLLDYGRVVHDHRGAEIVFFDHAARRRLAREQGDEAIKRLGTYAVLGSNGQVYTVGHRTRRLYGR